MKFFHKWLLLIAIVSSLVSACGGGGGTGDAVQAKALELKGQVVDSNGAVIAGAQVQLDTSTATTDAQGRFEIAQKQTSSSTQVLRITHPEFLLYAQDYVPATAGAEVQFKLISYEVTSTFASDSGAQLAVSEAKVLIPAKGLVTAIGAAYTGTVTARAHYGNHDTAAGVASFAQPYLGANGQTQNLLISAGVITVEMRDAQGGLLQLASGFRATLTYPASNTTGSATEIPMWYYDKIRAIWVREGAAVRQTDGSYVGQVSHFTPWNIDYPVDRITRVKGCLVDANNQPAASIHTYLVGTGFRTSGPTDSKGQFEAYVPNGIRLQLDSVLENDAVLEIPALVAGETRQLTSCLKLKPFDSHTPVKSPATWLQPTATTPVDPAKFLSSAGSATTAEALCSPADLANTLKSRGMSLQTTLVNETSLTASGIAELGADAMVYRYGGVSAFQGVERESLVITGYRLGQALGNDTEFFSASNTQFIEYGAVYSGEGSTSTLVWNTPRISPRQFSVGIPVELSGGSVTSTYLGNTQTITVQADQVTLQGYETIRMGGQTFETCRFTDVTRTATSTESIPFRGRYWVVASGELKGLWLIDESLDEGGGVISRMRVSGYQWVQR